MIALLMGGRYVKVLPADWELFLSEYEAATRHALPRPFPPLAVENLPNPGKRTPAMAAALRLNSNTLSQEWKRAKPLLEELEFIQRLRNPEDI